MNSHLTKDEPQGTLFQPNDPWITDEKDIRPYILGLLDNTKLSMSLYIAASIINYSPYINNMFDSKCLHNGSSVVLLLVWNPPEKLTDIIMPKYNQLLMGRYSDTSLL